MGESRAQSRAKWRVDYSKLRATPLGIDALSNLDRAEVLLQRVKQDVVLTAGEGGFLHRRCAGRRSFARDGRVIGGRRAAQ